MVEIDWIDQQHALEPGQKFRLHDGSVVELDRRVPGDGTQWYVLEQHNGGWFNDERTIEPGDIAKLIK